MNARKNSMHPQEMPKSRWQARTVFVRVFAPFVLVIVAVSLVRYHYMLESSTAAASQRARTETARIGHVLLAALHQLPPDDPEQARRVLQDSTVYFAPLLQIAQWQAQGQVQVEAVQPPSAPEAPDWFVKRVGIESPTLELSEQLDDGSTGSLKLGLQSSVFIDQVWSDLQVQSRISAFSILFVLVLLAWLARDQVRTMQRVSHAHRQIQRGNLAARMGGTGSPSERAMSESFNAMAAQLHERVRALEATQQQQAAQIAFARQLVLAASVPVSVRLSDGVCLDVQEEWLRLFGHPLPAAQASAPQAVPGLALPPALPAQPADALADSGVIAGTIGTLVTASDRHRTLQALHQAQQASMAPPAVPGGDGIITTDLQGTIETINEAAQFLTGYKTHQAMGRPLEEVFRLADSLHQAPDAEPVAGSQTTTPAHPILIHRSGERYAIEYTASAIRKSNGVAVGCVLVFHDVSESRHFRHQISWQAHHDALTGLHNRAALAESMTHAVFMAQQQHTLLAVCMIDLDHFQRFNQEHGSTKGDRALREVALRLRAFAGPHDAVARMAGDEFVLLLGNQPDLPAVQEHAARLLAQLCQPYAMDEEQLHITASMGVVVYPLADGSPTTLLRRADQAMCQAKQAGRQQLRFFDPQTDAMVQTPHSQQTRVAQALRTGEMRLHYQPQVRPTTGEIVAVEALLRWQHPEHGLQGPEYVLPLIEDADLVAELGEWVLKEALAQMQQWHAQGLDWTVGINIATAHLHRSNFAARLKDLLGLFAPLPAQLLQLEIQESAGAHEPPQLQALMHQCHQELGVRWALDDFGVGKATLAWVAQLPVDTLKIDQSIVKAVLHSAEDATVVTTMVAMAQALECTLVAEGAESADHALKLRELGCHVLQGYAIAHPMPGNEVADWARSYQRSVATASALH